MAHIQKPPKPAGSLPSPSLKRPDFMRLGAVDQPRRPFDWPLGDGSQKGQARKKKKKKKKKEHLRILRVRGIARRKSGV